MDRPTYYIKTENRRQELALKSLQTWGNRTQLNRIIKVSTTLTNTLPGCDEDFSVTKLLAAVVNMEIMLEQVKIIYTHDQPGMMEAIATVTFDELEEVLTTGWEE